MDHERYDLIFTGDLVPGAELPQVKRNLQALFRINEAQVNLLFSGRDVVLKKNLDAEAANKYRVAIKKAGARIRLASSAQPDTSPVANDPPAKKPSLAQESSAAQKTSESRSQPLPVAEVQELQDDPEVQQSKPRGEKPHGDQQSKPRGEEMLTALGAQAPKPAEPRAEIRAPDLPLAEPGADLLRPEERSSVQPVAVDISGLSVAPQSGNLLSSDELNRPVPAAVEVPDFEVAPPGSDVLRPDERTEFVSLELDLSGLDLAEAGAPLAPKRPAAPSAPNVDHIQLKDS